MLQRTCLLVLLALARACCTPPATPTPPARDDVPRADLAAARPPRVRVIAATADGPAPRVDASLTLAPAARAALLLGGADPRTGALRADAWRLALDTLAWTRLPFPVARAGHAAVSDGGTAVFVVGGRGPGGALPAAPLRIDARTLAVTALATAGAPSERAGVAACWTGREVLAWGGRDARGEVLGDGAAYDPARDRWRALAAAGAPRGRSEAALVWTGAAALLVGGSDDVSLPGELGAAAYDPVDERWRPVPPQPEEPAPFAGRVAVWSGHGLLVAASSGVHAYDPARDRWSRVADLVRRGAAPVAHARGLVLLGGVAPSGSYGTEALLLDATSGAVRVLAADALPSGREDALVASDGATAVVLFGRRGADEPLGDGAVIDLGD